MPKVSQSPASGLGGAFKPEVIAEPSKQNAEPASAESLREESAPKGLSSNELAELDRPKVIPIDPSDIGVIHQHNGLLLTYLEPEVVDRYFQKLYQGYSEEEAVSDFERYVNNEIENDVQHRLSSFHG
jgi:hypothetical protein